MIEVEGDGGITERPDKQYQPSASRWSGVKQSKNKKLSKVIDIEKNFNVRPYLSHLMASLSFSSMQILEGEQFCYRRIKYL